MAMDKIIESNILSCDSTSWPKVRFDQMAACLTVRVEPSETTLDRYVGLEHLDPETLKISRWGTPADVIGEKLHFWPGDIIFGKRRAYQRKLAVADFEGICSAHAMVLRAKPEVVLPEFLPFFMQSDLFFERALSISVGSLSPTINWSTLARQEFPLPPLDEQRRFAEILWAAEKTINYYYKLKINFHQYSQILTDYIMGEALLNKPKLVKLEEICEIPISNGIFTKRENFGKGTLLVNVKDIYENFRVVVENLDRVPAKPSEITRFSCLPGDIIFNRSSIVFSGIGWACLIPEISNDLLFECHLMRVRPNKNLIDPAFLTRYSLSRIGRKYIESVARMMTMTTINQQDLGNMLIPLLPLDEQRAISRKLDNLDEGIEQVTKHINSVKKFTRTFLNNKYLHLAGE